MVDLPSETFLIDERGLLREALDFIRQCESEHSEGGDGGALLVHCMQGVSRSASVVIAYLMESGNMSMDEALALVQSRREVANPNRGFSKHLRKIESKLRREN